ncbi:hypothetical protein VNO78_07722 [Psophocarpus tetragonolobus]|uniref:1,4-alpha-D-glucan glucanohydrolase n=1 Tax=Psophocarpus tetragonolobus TaxID=3891 RepID=A0AAN9XS61_PSOTE
MSTPPKDDAMAPMDCCLGHTKDACFSFKDEDFVKGRMKVKESLSGAQKFTSDIRFILGWIKCLGDIVINHRTVERKDGEEYIASLKLGQQMHVQRELSKWMNWLKIIWNKLDQILQQGRNGILFPMGKMGSLTITKTVIVGHWFESGGSVVTALDFTTKGILQYVVQRELWTLKDSNGKPLGMIGVKLENAVNFIDNHDIGTPLGKVVSILKLIR